MNQDKQFGGNQDKLSGGNLTDYAKKRMAHYAVMFAKSSDEELRQTMAHPINLGGNFLILQKIYTFVP